MPSPKDSQGSFNIEKPVETPTQQTPEVTPPGSASLDTVCKVKQIKQSNSWFAIVLVAYICMGAFFHYRTSANTKKIDDAVKLATWVKDATDAALVGVDSEGKIRLWNAGAQRIIGYSEQEAIGHNVEMIIPEEYRSAHSKALKLAMRTDSYAAKIVKCEILKANGYKINMTMILRRADDMFLATLYRDSETRVLDLKERVNAIKSRTAARSQ